MICALTSLMPANASRGIGHAARDHESETHIHHSHTHFHDGHEHTHWHSHAGHEDHSTNDPDSPSETDGDHHDEVVDHDHDDMPYSPPTTRIVHGRDSTGKQFLPTILCAAISQIQAPPRPPQQPPPWLLIKTDDLPQLRTVILLT